MRTYEPRQGRKAATAVCFVFAVVTLASSPFPQGLLAAKRSGYAVPVNLNSFFRSALIALACLALGKPTTTLAADKPPAGASGMCSAVPYLSEAAARLSFVAPRLH